MKILALNLTNMISLYGLLPTVHLDLWPKNLN